MTLVLVFRSKLFSSFRPNCEQRFSSSRELELIPYRDEQYWQQPLEHRSKDVKLLVKRTFITSDLGDNSLPKWASWVKVVIDGLSTHTLAKKMYWLIAFNVADDLPLNVSRETLQSNRFLKQLKGIILKRLIQLFNKIEEEDQDRFEKIQNVYGSILKLGAVEDTKNREKLAGLTRFATNQRNVTSLDQYLENKKKGQKHVRSLIIWRHIF